MMENYCIKRITLENLDPSSLGLIFLLPVNWELNYEPHRIMRMKSGKVCSVRDDYCYNYIAKDRIDLPWPNGTCEKAGCKLLSGQNC